MKTVIDASVVLKWFLDEEDSDTALKIRKKHLEGKLELCAPTLLVIEISNALCTKPDVKEETVLSALKAFYYTKVKLCPITKKLIKESIRLSIERKITVYDSLYVSLAKVKGCNFLTADKRLYEKVIDLEFVKLLK